MKALVTSLLSLTLSGCFVPVSQGKAIENDLRLLRDRLVAVEDRAETDDALLRERVAQAQRDAERIRETMAKVDKIARRADANFGEELVAMRRSIATIQGRLETIEHQSSTSAKPDPAVAAAQGELGQLKERVAAAEASLAALDQKLSMRAQAPAPKPVTKPKPAVDSKTAPKKSDESKPKAKTDDSSRGLFRAGRDALTGGRADGALGSVAWKKGKQALGA
jgi:chromosome segregation ATPase